jgi:hypothetical protein
MRCWLLFILAAGAAIGTAAWFFFHWIAPAVAWYWWVGGGALAAVCVVALAAVILIAKEGIAIPALALAAVLAAMHPTPARADAIAREGGDWVRLTTKMCTDQQVRSVISQQGMDPEAFRAAATHIRGQDYVACWRPVSGGAGLIYGDGDMGAVPIEDLKPVPET